MSNGVLALTMVALLSAEPGIAAPLIQPQTQGGVTFVSGGVGKGPQQAMRAVRREYNLHLTFAVKGIGEYVVGARVKIEDAANRTVLDTVSNGPMLFAKVSPGHYTVTADRNGDVLSEKVNVGPSRGTSVVFHFPRERGD